MKVIAIMQSNDGKSEPYPLTWGRHLSEAGVFESVAQIITAGKDEAPWAPRMLEIRIVL